MNKKKFIGMLFWNDAIYLYIYVYAPVGNGYGIWKVYSGSIKEDNYLFYKNSIINIEDYQNYLFYFYEELTSKKI